MVRGGNGANGGGCGGTSAEQDIINPPSLLQGTPPENTTMLASSAAGGGGVVAGPPSPPPPGSSEDSVVPVGQQLHSSKLRGGKTPPPLQMEECDIELSPDSGDGDGGVDGGVHLHDLEEEIHDHHLVEEEENHLFEEHHLEDGEMPEMIDDMGGLPELPASKSCFVLTEQQLSSTAECPAEILSGAKYLNSAIKKQSHDATLVVTNLPDVPAGNSAFAYMQYIEHLTADLHRVLLVRGTSAEVISAFA